MADEGLSEFLFEIASPERLSILEALSLRPMKHAEIARSLSFTGSETTRHLRRLARVGLVVKEGNGAYAPTALATALRAGLPFLEFLVLQRKFVSDHRLPGLDRAFVERLGELHRATLVEGAYEVVAVQESSLRAVHRRIWVVTEQRFEAALPILRDKAARGADVRVVRPKNLVTDEKDAGRDVHRNFALRVLPRIDAFLAVLDDRAGLCLLGPDDRIDMSAMLLVTDPGGCRWAEDVFLSYWERAEPWRAPDRAARSR